MKIKVDTEKYNENLLELATTFKSGNEFLDQFIQSKESLNDGLGKTKYRGIVIDEKKDGTKVKISDRLFADFMLKVYELRAEYIGFSFVTLAATDEGYSLYKRNYFEDLEEGLHFSFKDDEKGCKPMYFALYTE